MRYRPFGVAGKAVSAVSLLLREAPNMGSPQAWRTLVFSAMKSGINYFEVAAGLDVAALGLGEALKSVERRLLFLSWRLRGDPRGVLTAEAISHSIRGGLQKTGAGYFDLVMMDETAYETLAPDALEHPAQLRSAGPCLQIGVAGDGVQHHLRLAGAPPDPRGVGLQHDLDRLRAVSRRAWSRQPGCAGAQRPARARPGRAPGGRRHVRIPERHARLDARRDLPGLFPDRALLRHRSARDLPHRSHRADGRGHRQGPAHGGRRPDRDGPLRRGRRSSQGLGSRLARLDRRAGHP